jgi:hypothetical protein
MLFNELFEQFVRSSPACVMQRATMENVFAPAALDALFRRTAVVQYERELLFSTLVDLTGLVVCRISKSVHAAYVRKREKVGVSIRSVYDKLDGVEPGTSRALVQYTAERVGTLIRLVRGCRASLLKGYKVRILDGNHLAGTQHRLKVLRRTAAGALPGQSLVLLDPQRMLIEDVIPCEDGHAQERALLDQVLPSIRKRDVVLDDRNFCTLGFLFALKARKAYFITRQHAQMPCKPLDKERYVGPSSTGRVYEGTVELCDPQTGKVTHVRRIVVKLRKPTRDGETEIRLLTNLPAKVGAVRIAELYRHRWTLEEAFNELTTHLRCELNTLGYPKAALFAFCVAACSYNLLAAVKGALRGVHGEETMEMKVSNFFLTDEISGVYQGMMIALPPSQWAVFQTMPAARLAGCLRRWASAADLENYPKHPRGPKKPVSRRLNRKHPHVATARLLAAAPASRSKKPKPKSGSP